MANSTKYVPSEKSNGADGILGLLPIMRRTRYSGFGKMQAMHKSAHYGEGKAHFGESENEGPKIGQRAGNNACRPL